MDTESTHYLIELWDADRDKLDSVTATRQILTEAARRARVTVLHAAFHKFNPVGVSGVVVIAESHISIHTWPEAGYAAADIFTCGDHAMPEVAARYIGEALEARQVEINRLTRGVRPADRRQPGLPLAPRPAAHLQA